jgi:hypothetical protein
MSAVLTTNGQRPVAAVALAGASLVATAAVASVFLRGALEAWTAVDAAGPAGPADAILLLTALCGTLLSLWLGLGTTLSALSALPGALGATCRGLAARVAPAAVRKVVAFILGTTLTAALVPGTAVAGIDDQMFPRGAVVATAQQAPHTGGAVAVAAPDASFRFVADAPPGRPAQDPHHDTDPAPLPSWLPQRPEPRTKPATATDDVVVLRGDTLWSIAAHHLGPAATAADIDTEWHRWLAANHQVIGDDPDLILPGQLLRPPPASQATS